MKIGMASTRVFSISSVKKKVSQTNNSHRMTTQLKALAVAIIQKPEEIPAVAISFN